jgi:hypothetical protein
VAVLASGPSMSQVVADSVRHLPRIAVNNTYLLAPDADVIYAGDAAWWKAHSEALTCPGIKATIEPLPGHAPAVPDVVHLLRNTGREGFDHDPGSLRTHNNSGACAVQIAAHGGAARIELYGFDMMGGHWHAPHAEPLSYASEGQMALWRKRFPVLVLALAARGIEVVNAPQRMAA